jgi:hypothetical protein
LVLIVVTLTTNGVFCNYLIGTVLGFVAYRKSLLVKGIAGDLERLGGGLTAGYKMLFKTLFANKGGALPCHMDPDNGGPNLDIDS